jgi:hypothetical protein
MKSKNVLCGIAMAVVLQLGVLAGSAQTNIYLYSGTETNITLNPGTYIITAYGAPGGGNLYGGGVGGYGAEMSGEFNFSTSTNLTLLVGGGGVDSGGGGGSFVVEGSTPLVIAGGGGGLGEGPRTIVENGRVMTTGGGGTGSGGGGTGGGGGGGGINTGGGGGGFLGNGGGDTNNGGGGGYSFENGGYGGGGFNGEGGGSGGYGGGGGGIGYFTGDYYQGGGGGGGYSGGGGNYFTDSRGGGGGGSVIEYATILTEVSGIASPDDYYNGEIIITAVPTPLVIITTGAAFGFTNGVFGFNVTGPSGSNVVIQASTDLHTWIPLQTNLLGSGPLYFSDPQAATNLVRFYRVRSP